MDRAHGDAEAAQRVPADFKIDAYVVVNQYEGATAPPCAITDEIAVVRVE